MNLFFWHAERKSSIWEVACFDVEEFHYLGCMPDPRTSFEVLLPMLNGEQVGVLVFGRPEATRCQDWYGSVEDVAAGRCEVTRWQVLNLSRVLLYSQWQSGGEYCNPKGVPGFTDRRGAFRSTLASSFLHLAAERVGFEYLTNRPPCFLDEPYAICWLMSYCDSAKHRGTIYQAAGWELYRTNERGIQTWRTRLPPLTSQQDAAVRAIAGTHPRSVKYRAMRASHAQLAMEM
jgi:hypothetical protein